MIQPTIMPRTTEPTMSPSQRPSMIAITGVLGIVLFSVILGVLGPQIVRRSSLAASLPLSSVLEVVHKYYQTEEFMRLRRSAGDSTNPRSGPPSIDDSDIRDAMRSAFGDRGEIVQIDAPRLVPVTIQRDVELEFFDRPGLAVIFEEQLPPDSLVRAANFIMLYMPTDPMLREVHARDEFGILGLLETGEPVLRAVSRGAGETWVFFWTTEDLTYFMLAPSEEMLDYAIEHSSVTGIAATPSSSA